VIGRGPTVTGEIRPAGSGGVARWLTTPGHLQHAQVSDIAIFTSGTRSAHSPAQFAWRKNPEGKWRGREMSMELRITLMSVLVGAYLVCFGLLTGVVIDRMLFDKHRSQVLGAYERALRDWHSYQMMLEKATTQRTVHPEE
jgi:hypothetical protein